MTGFLRFLGLINAAVWLGATVFFLLGAEPATSSRQLRELIGTNNFPYFSVALGHLLSSRFLSLHLVCAGVAVLHMGTEWLYLGKYPAKFWLGLLAALCLLGIGQSWLVQPTLRESHGLQFRQRIPLEQRESAARSFRIWQGISRGVNVAILVGLGLYFWRVGNPSDPMKFVSASPFRG